jgi:hypothetical protein
MGRPKRLEAAYVLAIAAMATGGFVAGSTATILITALLALPTALPALVAYYISYGLLALVPGANPDTNTGSLSCSPNGRCQGSTTGDVAAWLTLSSHVIAILLLSAAAVVNVVLFRLAASWRRAHVRATGSLSQ